jgi:hypothetical protein
VVMVERKRGRRDKGRKDEREQEGEASVQFVRS